MDGNVRRYVGANAPLLWIVLAVLARIVVLDHPNGSDIRVFEKALSHINGYNLKLKWRRELATGTAIVANEVPGTSFESFSCPMVAGLGMSYGSNTWRFRNYWPNRTCRLEAGRWDGSMATTGRHFASEAKPF